MRGEVAVASAVPRGADPRSTLALVAEAVLATEPLCVFDSGLLAWPNAVTGANSIAQTSTHRQVSLFKNNRLAFIFFSLLMDFSDAFHGSAGHISRSRRCRQVVRGNTGKPIVCSADGYGLNPGWFLQALTVF